MTRSSLRYSSSILLILFLGACRGATPREASGELLAGIPALPRSAPASISAGADAVEAGYTSTLPPDSVAAWYRRWFIKDGWHINGDLPAAGSVTLYVEKGRRPIWLIIRPLADHQGSVFSVVAAEDSAAASGPQR